MRFHALALCALLAIAATPAAAQTGANVLVVANTASADSTRIAEEYARIRAVPPEQVLRLEVAADEEIERPVFERQIQNPIAAWLMRNAAQDRILYFVLTKGVPLRIKGTGGREGTTASVDSELTLLYRRMTGVAAFVAGSVPNPYYLGDAPVAQAQRFSHATHDIYLVTRLDGFTLADVRGLVERGARPSREGRVVLDQKAGLADAGGDRWLQAAADALGAAGFGPRVLLETTTRSVTGEKDVLGYYSWGSNDPSHTARHLGLGFVPGAIGAQFVSTDARTFKEPPAAWATGSWTDRTRFYAGSPQSLTGDLVRDGITGAAGYVAEPFLDATVRPNVLFPAYFAGFDLAESFYLALPSLSWQAVVVGDPLCAPFARPPLAGADIDKGLDPGAEAPAYFAARRLKAALAASPGVKPEAVQAMLRAEARGAKDDKAGSQKALEEATQIDPKLAAAHLLLATAYDQAADYDRAIERYRQVLATNPNHPVSLNNLAYDLAVRKQQPAEALGYARKAYALSPTPVIADTLGWVQHLLGQDREAARVLAGAAAQMPGNAEVRMHAGVVFAAMGMVDAAQKELAAAVRLDPALEKRPEVAEARLRLKAK